jgi:hypothetical protein
VILVELRGQATEPAEPQVYGVSMMKRFVQLACSTICPENHDCSDPADPRLETFIGLAWSLGVIELVSSLISSDHSGASPRQIWPLSPSSYPG